MALHCLIYISKRNKEEERWSEIVLFKITASLTLLWCLASFELPHADEAKYETALHLKMNTIDNSINSM